VVSVIVDAVESVSSSSPHAARNTPPAAVPPESAMKRRLETEVLIRFSFVLDRSQVMRPPGGIGSLAAASRADVLGALAACERRDADCVCCG
jgi:hypothetical protein